MQESIYTFFKFDERAVICKVPNATFYNRIDGITLFNFFPWISLRLFHSQRKLLATFIYSKNHYVNLVPYLHHLVRVIDSFCPRHLTDVYQSFDTGLKLNKRTVAHDVNNFTLYFRVNRVSILDAFPRVSRFLFHPQSYFLFLMINFQDHHLNFLIDRYHLCWVSNPFPTHIGNM